MLRTTPFAAALLLLLTATAPALPSTGDPVPSDTYSKLRAAVLDRAHGDLSGLGKVTLDTPEGRVERAIDGNQFLADVKAVVEGRGFPGGAHTQDIMAPGAVGYGTRDGHTQDWPYCDFVSLWTLTYGGSALSHTVQDPLGLFGPRESICGGFYGSTQAWSDVTFDTRAPFAGAVLEACGAANYGGPWQAGIGFFGGYYCGWDQACAVGNGVLYREEWFGFHFDYFLGQHATIWMGDSLLTSQNCMEL